MHPVRSALVLLSLAASGSALATPMLVGQQGRVFGPDGEPLEGEHTVTFSIYPTRDAVGPSWTEDLTLDFAEGFYAAVLGDDLDNPLDDFVFDGDVLFVDIAIDGSEPLHPRQVIGSVPYAIRADVTSRLEGGTIDAASIAVDGTPVIDADGNWVGPVPEVTFADLGGLPVGLQTFADLGVSCFDGDVPKWDDLADGWACGPDEVLTEQQVDAYAGDNGYALDSALAQVAKSGTYAHLNGKPNLAAVATSGAYADLSGKPALVGVATSGAYADLSGKPVLSAVATSGDYDDLTDAPDLAVVATSGDYDDLTGQPTFEADAPLTVTGTTYGLAVPTCTTGQALTWNGTSLLCKATVPSGAILFFPDLCPTGWTEYTALRGRVAIGLPTDGTPALTHGTALDNNGARSITDVPAHTHSIDPPNTGTSTDGSHAHGINTRQDDYNASGGTGPSFGSDNGVYQAWQSTAAAGSHSHTVDVAEFTSGSTGSSSVEVTMPYIQLRACQAP